jgi:hypothetical protein
MLIAVIVLMLITSMGIFGFLSKAHSDQAVPTGDIAAQVSVFDEKIKTQRDNIEAARRALSQMDAQVDQVLGRSDDARGAERAVQIRRNQARERAALQTEIANAQSVIAKLNEEKAPFASKLRAVEAEVGPIKYIAAMVYGDNPDANLLEKAVRWVIILIVIVFDPLALTLLLAATKTFEWERGVNVMAPRKKEQEPWDEFFNKPGTDLEPDVVPPVTDKKPFYAGINEYWPFAKTQAVEINPVPDVYVPDAMDVYNNELVVDISKPQPAVQSHDEDHDPEDTPEIKAAKSLWKERNPNDTLKHQRNLLAQGKIDRLPWLGLVADNIAPREISSGFGIEFPTNPNKGDSFVRVDRLPSVLYKFNGDIWIEVDKSLTDNYTYDTAYITHLIEKLSTGELDPDLLSESEKEQVTHQLQSKTA